MNVLRKAAMVLCVLSLLFVFCGCNGGRSKQKYTKTYLNYFDTATVIIGYENNEEEFLNIANKISAMLKEYHELYDIYKRYDGIINLADINATYDGEHREYVVDARIMDLLVFAKEMYNITGGETNIAMGSVLSIWHDYREKGINHPSEASVPPIEKLTEASKHTDINNLILNEENMTVYISDPKMTLDVGAVAKGYATEMIARELEKMGVSGYTLNVGGNVRTVGTKPDGSAWVVGIENPDDGALEQFVEYLCISGESLVTSGSYQRYYYVNGTSYHHIIDKDTFYPSEYYTSVSVVCADSALADSLSTAIFSMKFEEGLELIESIDGVEAMWYTKAGEKMYSSGFSNYLKK